MPVPLAMREVGNMPIVLARIPQTARLDRTHLLEVKERDPGPESRVAIGDVRTERREQLRQITRELEAVPEGKQLELERGRQRARARRVLEQAQRHGQRLAGAQLVEIGAKSV